MNDKSNPNEDIAEDASENSEEKNSDESQNNAKDQSKESEIETEKPDENIDKAEDTSGETKEIKPEDKPVDTQDKKVKAKTKEKTEDKKGKPKKDRGPDFKYIVRISNTDIDGEKNVVYGLASIKGIGVHMATLITAKTGIAGNIKIGDLKDDQIEKLQTTINNIIEIAPGWMLNHRKFYETGEDIHLISSEIDMQLRDEINIMKKIRSYRGIRHERGLPVRGQRTRANNRIGLALGVSKKREPTTTTK